MFFIGIFSSPLPYLALFSIYLIGMINYSYHTKGEQGEAYTQDKAIKLDEKQLYASAGDSEKTCYFDHFYQDHTNDQVVCSAQILDQVHLYHTKTHAVYDFHFQQPVFSSSLFIRPPPYLM